MSQTINCPKQPNVVNPQTSQPPNVPRHQTSQTTKRFRFRIGRIESIQPFLLNQPMQISYSATRNWIKSAPQIDATTFAFASLFILLLCLHVISLSQLLFIESQLAFAAAATLLEKFRQILLSCIWLRTILQSSMWRKVSPTRRKWSKILSHRAKQ